MSATPTILPDAPPDAAELDALLRLLDDETPEVRASIAGRFALFGGDISEIIAPRLLSLGSHEREVLSSMLAPARADTLEREWIVPTRGAAALHDDWDLFEALLRLLSDFLHDGLTLRQPLSDALDLLAEEATACSSTSPFALREFLFSEGGKLSPNTSEDDLPADYDLTRAIDEGTSGPIGLCILYILVGRRLGLDIQGVPYPGHFLARYHDQGHPVIVDCYDHGQVHLQVTLLENSDLDRHERTCLRQSAHPGAILSIFMRDLTAALAAVGRGSDAGLVARLAKSLE